MSDPEICTALPHDHSKMSNPEDPVHSDAEVSDDTGSSGEDSSEDDSSEDSSEEDSPEEDTSEEGRDIAWVPPKLAAVDMAYTIRELMPLDEHRQKDKFIFDFITSLRGRCPSPEDVLSNVNTASCFLLLVMQTASSNIPLKPQWKSLANLRAVVKQEIVRKTLANAVRCKTFMRMRCLGLWYEGY
ncbi:hypothetical protein OBBRIDRAFT_891180 [Obba rivulosa]|uniref:PiggyBac transposable element-derived protein domain-containing protein n=1 Tax=Obba rivulosa TaxID=1052685 RepID=A0A8E2DG01_9APHY|nr:hypothetical protein OBBRIDRAFT_891180 [Obba rivulosa]